MADVFSLFCQKLGVINNSKIINNNPHYIFRLTVDHHSIDIYFNSSAGLIGYKKSDCIDDIKNIVLVETKISHSVLSAALTGKISKSNIFMDGKGEIIQSLSLNDYRLFREILNNEKIKKLHTYFYEQIPETSNYSDLFNAIDHDCDLLSYVKDPGKISSSSELYLLATSECSRLKSDRLYAHCGIDLDKGCHDKRQIIAYLAAPNDEVGNLSEMAKNRLNQFISQANRYPTSLLILTGGFGNHYNKSKKPHYEHAFQYLKSSAPAIAERIESCLPTVHSYHDVLMCDWYAAEVNALKLTIITSSYHKERISFLFSLVKNTDYALDIYGCEFEEKANNLIQHDLAALSTSLITAFVLGREHRIW